LFNMKTYGNRTGKGVGGKFRSPVAEILKPRGFRAQSTRRVLTSSEFSYPAHILKCFIK